MMDPGIYRYVPRPNMSMEALVTSEFIRNHEEGKPKKKFHHMSRVDADLRRKKARAQKKARRKTKEAR